MKNQPRFSEQLMTMMTNNLRVEITSPDRLLSPILFAATLLLCFSFALSRLPSEVSLPIFIAETILTAFFALQICFSRIFEPDTGDKVYDLLRTYPVNPTAWFLSKYFSVVILGLMILLPTMILSNFFHGESGASILTPTFVAIAIMTLLGLAALGVLLALITMDSGARAILYPLLYFPLTTPVLLSAIESGRSHLLDNEGLMELLQSWLGLLVIFDIIYFTLGILLFSELIKAD